MPFAVNVRIISTSSSDLNISRSMYIIKSLNHTSLILLGLATGRLTTFVDVGYSFGAPDIVEDPQIRS
ncbi:hypothetical protein MTR_8g068940 [Medicago truncatula]|uniref:Uncharacterized protein n=1 Tax=Medicago truncatula TaxID=3880 RepID=G7LJ86_MEDTR|nr:hypothetical protein MTR_8g068940 [Medicago truncatula]